MGSEPRPELRVVPPPPQLPGASADERQLVGLILRRDRKATARFVADYADSVYAYVRHRLAPRTDFVEDVVQEVFLAALDGLPQFAGTSGLRGWLLGIARHKVEDYYRRQLRAPESLADESENVGPAAEGPLIDEVIDRDRLEKMIAKYGKPNDVTAQRLIWHNNGPWKRTELVNEEVPHDFPMPHKDMLKQVINYRIDPDDGDELAEYDGSVILERTKGEIAARCDKEEANFLAINLANDIATGRRDVRDARRFYAESITALMKGKPNDYVQGFRFNVARDDQGDRDKPFGPVGMSGR